MGSSATMAPRMSIPEYHQHKPTRDGLVGPRLSLWGWMQTRIEYLVLKSSRVLVRDCIGSEVASHVLSYSRMRVAKTAKSVSSATCASRAKRSAARRSV